MDNKITIESDKILAVEGKDEFYFFEKLLKVKGINNIQVIDIGGKEQFKVKFPLLCNAEGFLNVNTIGIVRDAEENKASSAFQSICNILKRNSIPSPKSMNTIDTSFVDDITFKVGVFIMPNNIDSGMLEDLCLESVENENVFQCIEQYFDCLKEVNLDSEKINVSKSKVLTYLATKKPIVNTLGLAAQKGYWDFSSSCFDDVKKFLDDLFLDKI